MVSGTTQFPREMVVRPSLHRLWLSFLLWRNPKNSLLWSKFWGAAWLHSTPNGINFPCFNFPFSSEAPVGRTRIWGPLVWQVVSDTLLFLGNWWSEPVYKGSDSHFPREGILRIQHFGATYEGRHDCIRLPMVLISHALISHFHMSARRVITCNQDISIGHH